MIPIKISGPIITTHMAYFLTNDSIPKGKDPNISVTLKKIMSETVTPDTFNPPCHELYTAVQDNLKLLLQEYE